MKAKMIIPVTRARNSDMWRYLQLPSAVENIERRRNRQAQAAIEKWARG
jgi:hypothetical protein